MLCVIVLYFIPSFQVVAEEDGINLIVPIVAFPSTQFSVSSNMLADLANGEYVPSVLISETAVEVLATADIELATDIPVIEDEDVTATLWKNANQIALVSFESVEVNRQRILWVDEEPIVEQLEDYPLVVPSDAPTFDPNQLTRITVSGVTALARRTLEALDTNGVEWAASGIQAYVVATDYFHMSNEVSIHPDCPSTEFSVYGNNRSFCSKLGHFSLLELLDVDLVELTGNHNNDFGFDAYESTFALYQDREIPTVGGGLSLDQARIPVAFTHHNNRIAWVACNAVGPYYAWVNENPDFLGGVRPGATDCESEWLESLLGTLSATNDVVILTVQTEEVLEPEPIDNQRHEFQQFADWGADVVIGTASHVPQVFEFYPASDISFLHYGLGNLYFDQPFAANTKFFMDTLYIYEGQLHSVELFPGVIEGDGRPRLMTEKERSNFLFSIFALDNRFS